MAKTVTQMLADWRQHIGEEDSSNTTSSDAQGLIWMNEGYGVICDRLRHLPRKERDYSLSTYDATEGLTLNSETIAVDRCLLLNPDTGKYEELEVKDFDELLDMDPDYQSVEDGMPMLMARKSTFTAILYPTPSAAVMAQTTPLRTYGLERPDDLEDDGDTPNIPGNLHRLIPHWMAYRHFAKQHNQEKVTEHLTLFNSGLKDNKGLATEFSKQTKHWKALPGIQ